MDNKPEDDCEIERNHSCGCGISSCGLKMWIVLGIVIVAIWYFIR